MEYINNWLNQNSYFVKYINNSLNQNNYLVDRIIKIKIKIRIIKTISLNFALFDQPCKSDF